VYFFNVSFTFNRFSSRISATSLLPFGYSEIPTEQQREIRGVYLQLCADEAPMVRRAAALNFRNLLNEMLVVQDKAVFVDQKFLDAFEKLARDTQDSVRIQVSRSFLLVGAFLPNEVKLARLLPLVSAIAADKSWRVRWSAAIYLHEICASLGPQITNDSLLPICENLVNDSEAEVRSAAAGNIPSFSKLFRKDLVLVRIISLIHHLVEDPSELVRCSLASVINDMASILGKEDTIQHLLPLLLLLLRDTSSEVDHRVFYFLLRHYFVIIELL